MGDQDVRTARSPQYLNVNTVRAAHLYNVTSTKIREAMMICGLSNIISVSNANLSHAFVLFYHNYHRTYFLATILQDVSLFDGVYFQNLMDTASGPQILSRIEAIASLHSHRVYSTLIQ